MSDQGTQNVVRSSKRYAAFSKHCDPVFEAYALVKERGRGGEGVSSLLHLINKLFWQWNI